VRCARADAGAASPEGFVRSVSTLPVCYALLMSRMTRALRVRHERIRCRGGRRAGHMSASAMIVAVLVFAGVAPVGCTSEDPPAPETVTEAEGRQSTLGRAVDVAERTRDEADRYNEELEKAADPSDW